MYCTFTIIINTTTTTTLHGQLAFVKEKKGLIQSFNGITLTIDTKLTLPTQLT
jgi:hypothetical protein